MATLTRYTTPAFPFTIPADLTGAHLYINFEQLGVNLKKSVGSFTVADGITSFTVALTQAETAQFVADLPVSVQGNWIFSNGDRGATFSVEVPTYRNLLNEVISYGN